MDETNRCASCGGQSPADAAFCIECGAALAPRAATGPTRVLQEPAPRIYTRPAAPPRPPRAAPGGELLVPLLVIAGAVALLLAPRMAPMILVALGTVGLLARGCIARPDRMLPVLVLAGFVALLVAGGKFFWPVLIGFFVLRAVLRGRIIR